MRVADYVMARLAEAGVSHVFLVTGRGALFLTDALARRGDLHAVSMHHEQAAAYAAVGYAQQGDRLGACLVSTGCAATNAITGVLCAWQDGVPCIVISGQNTLKETVRFTGIGLRTYGQQEADIVAMVSPITKFATMVTKAEDIVQVMDTALAAALSGRQGPVWIDIPLDIQSATVDLPSPEAIALQAPDAAAPDLGVLLAALEAARRPIVLIGHGVRSAGAIAALRHWIERWRIPLVYTPSAPDTYGTTHELCLGSVGAMGCSRAGNFALQNADLVLVLGARLNSLTVGPDPEKFARAARIVVVDIDPVEHSKQALRIDTLVTADLRDLLPALNEHAPKAIREDWVLKCLHWKQLFSGVETQFTCDDLVDLYRLSDDLSEVLPSPSTLVTDSGLAEVILPSNVRFSDGVRVVHPASQGAMGYALPAAIGAHFAGHGPVVAVIGDGSIMMNLQELETIRFHRLPIKIFVINNNAYSIIRRRQKELFRNRVIGTDPQTGLSCPNFSSVAACFGMQFRKIDTPHGLRDNLAAVISQEGAVLCEIMGRPDQGYIELGHARSTVSGRWVRRPLEDQAPFLDRKVFLDEMIVDPIDQ